MKNFAKVNAFGVVENVIVSSESFIKSQSDASSYIETFEDANGDPAKFYNFASKGSIFDPLNKAFVLPQPYPSWSLNKETFSWQSPVPVPLDQKVYFWDEDTQNWVTHYV